MKIFAFLGVSILSFASAPLWAQSSLLGLDSGRYEVKKTNATKPEMRKPASRKPASDEPPQVEAPGDGLTVSPVPANAAAVSESNTSELPVKQEAEPSLGEQAASLFKSQEKVLGFYRDNIHPDDVRNNQLELEISPTFVHVESKSNYSFRDYKTNFQALHAEGNLWLAPRFGIQGSFLTSLGGDVVDNPGAQTRARAQFEEMRLSLAGRKFFGLSRKSDAVEFKLSYLDSRLKVDSSSTNRLGAKSTGLGVGASLRVPSSLQHSWMFSAEIYPRVSHVEIKGADASSGTGARSSRVAVEVGGEYKFDRQSQFIWSLEMDYEKNSFDGSSSVADPMTGVTPKNVGVENNLLLFRLGYRWGR